MRKDEDIEGTVSIEEVIPDEMYQGKVAESMENGTYFMDSMKRIKDLEIAIGWCFSAGCSDWHLDNALTDQIKKLLSDRWF